MARAIAVTHVAFDPGGAMEIHVLSYARKLPDGRLTGMTVGYYSSLENLEKAKARLLERPGFTDFPQGFYINSYRLDQEYDDPLFFTKWPVA